MKHTANAWVKGFPGEVMVCDAEGILLEMNDQAAQALEADGGLALIGKNILDCHPEPARSKFQRMLTEKTPNIYTIEKKGVKKLIYQSPWYDKGRFAGFIELSVEIPFEMPHFVRD